MRVSWSVAAITICSSQNTQLPCRILPVSIWRYHGGLVNSCDLSYAMLAKGVESLRHNAFPVPGEAPFNYSLGEQHKSVVVVYVQDNRVLQLITA